MKEFDMEKRTCKMCDGNYEGTWRSAYCSEACRRAWRRNQASEFRKTDQYQKWYRERVDSGGFAAASRKMRAARRVERVVPCRYCGGDLLALGRQTRVICQSSECTYHYNRDKVSLALATRAGVEIGEPFTYLEILERDGWSCGICGDQIDPDAHYPDRMCASIDHIVPLSRGGAHSRENVQAAHFVCNARKNDSVLTVTGRRL